jgi:hypothetical protein
MSSRFLGVALVAMALWVCASGTAWAQSGISGVVRDTSGAVLPGVTVEAASPALIEKVRTATTDGGGAYTIIDLRPGEYSVTFSLPGFSTVRRDGISLPASFTATVNADMTVGAVEETITVSGAAPLVDVTNVSTSRVLSSEIIDAIPASRTPQGYAALTPGITSQGIGVIPGGVNEMQTTIHGANVAESMWTIDGVSTATVHAVGGGSNLFRVSAAYISEMSVMTGGGTAVFPYGGMVTNIIPKEGGNTFSGNFYAEYTGESFAQDNLTPELEAQGFTKNGLTMLTKQWDISPAFGGRILRDKLWFFSSFRTFGVVQTRAGVFDNLTPRGWVITPDLNRPALAKLTQLSRSTRLTWQVTPRNKFSLFVDAAPHVVWNRGYQNPPPPSPEATHYVPYVPNGFMTASWKSPVTNQWMFEANIGYIAADFNQRRQTTEHCLCSAPDIGFDVIAAIETATSMTFRAAELPGNYGHTASHALSYSATASYITGSHAVKFGLQNRVGPEYFTQEPNGGVVYSLRNGVPLSIRQYATPIFYQNNINMELGLYAQDVWRVNRLTITGGVRFDAFKMSAPDHHIDAGFWVPARNFDGVLEARWNTVAPRIAASYDLFGDGKTALKASVGKFVAAQTASGGGLGGNNPSVRSVLSVTRTWTDANGNYNPDCDLVNRLANGECGQISDLNFGQSNPNSTRYADELITGLRPGNWETTLVAQRELMRGVSVSLGYYKRVFQKFTANDNLFVTPSDFTHYCVTAPVDSRLPDGGGNQICGLYDVVPALFGRTQTLVSPADRFGDQEQVYDGIDLTENIRFSNGVLISGGVNWGRTRTKTCFAIDSPGALRFCEVKPPFNPTLTFVGSVPLPAGFLVSGTFRDYPGPEIQANRLYTNAEIAPSLGRNLSNGANGTVNIALVEPGTMYGSHAREIDMRFSKRFRFGGTKRIMANLDIFNLLNQTGVNTINFTYGSAWQRPTLLQYGRFFKLSGQIDF